MHVRFAFLIIVMALSPGAGMAADGARAAVAQLHAALETQPQESPQSCSTRVAMIGPVIAAVFDTAAIARLVLRTHWTALDESRRTAFVAALQENIALNYGRHFAGGAGQRFVIDGEEPQGRFVRVRARLPRTDQPAVTFDYLLHEADGWRIVNVFADGVSDAAVRRSQYDSLVGERGIDGLIGFVESQNKNLLRECNGS